MKAYWPIFLGSIHHLVRIFISEKFDFFSSVKQSTSETEIHQVKHHSEFSTKNGHELCTYSSWMLEIGKSRLKKKDTLLELRDEKETRLNDSKDHSASTRVQLRPRQNHTLQNQTSKRNIRYFCLLGKMSQNHFQQVVEWLRGRHCTIGRQDDLHTDMNVLCNLLTRRQVVRMGRYFMFEP